MYAAKWILYVCEEVENVSFKRNKFVLFHIPGKRVDHAESVHTVSGLLCIKKKNVGESIFSRG